MAEAAGQSGGDPVLMIRGVLDMTQPYQELQSLGRAASEGTTFSNTGTPGTTSNNASRERASRAVERTADLGDVEQASFNVSARESRAAAARRADTIGTWGATAGPTGGGVVRFRGEGDVLARSTGPVRRAYRQNEYSEDWESAVNQFAAVDPWSAQAASEGAAKRARAFGHAARMGQRDWESSQVAGEMATEKDVFSRQLMSGVSAHFAQREDVQREMGVERDVFSRRLMGRVGRVYDDQVEAKRQRIFGHAARYGQEDWDRRVARGDFLGEFGPGGGPRAAYNRGRAETQAEENAPADAPHGPGFGPTAETNELRAGEQAANATWARRNLPSIFGRGGNRGGMSVFYRRFLMLEGIRAASEAINQVSQAGINTAATLGDPMAMAQSTIANVQGIAGAIPFAGAGVYGLANIVMGGPANDVARAAASVQIANQTMAVNATLGAARLDLAQQGSVWAAPRGTLRESRNIQVGLEQTRADIRAREAQGADAGAARAAQERSDARSGLWGTLRSISASGSNFLFGTEGSGYHTGADDTGFEAEDQQASQGAGMSRRLAAERRQRDEKIAEDRAKRQQSELFTDAGLDIRSSLAEGGTASYQASQTLMPNAGNFNSLRFGQSQRRQQREFGYQQFVTQQENQMATERAKDPLLAPFRWVGHMGERMLRRTQTDVANTQDELQTSNQIGAGNQQYATATSVMSARLGRNPDAAITAQHAGDIAGVKFLPPEMQAGATAAADSQRDLSQQQLQDSRLAAAGNLQLRRTVSAIRANAYGPDGRTQLRGADITQMAGNAELEAQGILRQDSTSAGQQMADSARQIGVNNLNSYAANYARGFKSTSRSRFEIAPGNEDSENPSKVFAMVDQAIAGLKGNKGQINVAGTKGSTADAVPQLLTQILAALTTGGALRATE